MLQAGLIGMGRMGITHFAILNAHPSVKITSVCDQSKTMLSFFKEHTGVVPFTNHHELVNQPGLDMVVISTPADSHADIVRAALQKGLHVFVEKPFTMNLKQGRKLLDLAREKKRVNQVGYVNRFNEVFMEVKKLLKADMIGEVKYFKFEMAGSTVTRDSKSSWRSKRHLGGGCMYEFASHCIDLAVYLIGKPDQLAGNVLQRVYSSNVEDIVTSTFIYKSGTVGNIIVNWSDFSARKPFNKIEIYGKKGKIVADKHAYKVFLKETDAANGFHKGWNTRYITDFSAKVHFYVRGNEFSMQLSHFVDCINDVEKQNLSSFADAYATDMIMHDIFADSVEVKR